MAIAEEDNFLNNEQKPVHWKFIDVSELHALNELVDGTEIYSCIREEDNADEYIKITSKARQLFTRKMFGRNI